jgi:glycosyltransferase involved in cell wall biosynthesis
MKKKKILFVIANFNIGGPQKSLLALLYKINQDLFDINLLVLSGEGTLLKYLPSGIKLLEPDDKVKYSLLSINQLKSKTYSMLKNKGWVLVFNAIFALLRGVLIRNMGQARQKYWLKVKHVLPQVKGQFDVAIGVSGGHSMMFIADCISSHKKISWIRSDYRVLKRDLEIDREYFRKMDTIFSVSHQCKEIFNNIFPEYRNKVEVIYNMLPFKIYENIEARTELIPKNDNEIILLSISRLDPGKGLDLALEALEILIKKNRKVRWYVLGDGRFRSEIEQIINDKGLRDHFILLGFQLNTMAFIEKCDIFVHPSRFEGKSNAVDEAKYALKPIVVTNYETVTEQISHKKTGLIAEMNPHSIATNIEYFLDNPLIFNEIRENLENSRYDDSVSLEQFQKLVSS